MSKVFINESTLTAIGDAIRDKTGGSALISPTDMPTEISGIASGGGDLPEEAFVISRDCSYRFAYNGWNWFINEYGDRVTTKDITNANSMFSYSDVTEIPFDINFDNTTYRDANFMFNSCNNLKEIGKIKNLYPSTLQNMFGGCNKLRYLPEFENLNMNRIYSYNYCNISSMFQSCYSLREISEGLLKQLYNPKITSPSYSLFYNGFTSCFALDEIRGLSPQIESIGSNMFYNTFKECYRLKDIIFATQDDGTPYSMSWKSQTIDLSIYIGYVPLIYIKRIYENNSGITTDKHIHDDETYANLKNDKDCFTTDKAYSRYNHDSAVNTINSLPDVSQSGAANTIKFYGASGEKTDGGAINTLTEEEIAVATAKGWTISFV